MQKDRKSINIQIGLRVSEQRRILHMSQRELCDIIDISEPFLSDIENGRKGPSPETILKLCNGLSVSADYLLTGRETVPDASPLVAALANIDPEYLPLAEEHLKIFLKTIGKLKSRQDEKPGP